MPRTLACVSTIVLAALGVGGCSTIGVSPPDVPGVIKAPADQEPFLEALATGAQVYECVPKQSGGYEWAFRAPEAKLTSRLLGSDLGKHYAGPTWEAPDGSRVLGEAKERAPAPDPNAIPWLLLNAKSTFGKGVFTQTKSVQRVATKGGTTPTEPCSASNANQFARVPYTATYYFYRSR
ncbi:MAG TPA: DUF3455 domain-containing protein [Burkholderiaceae bacterium]|nr:DUF3455 domain-containing protein [Burkholderiaceae bacterium]